MNPKIERKAKLDKLMKDKKYKKLKNEYFKLEIQFIIDAIYKECDRLDKEEPNNVNKYNKIHSFLEYENNPYMFKQQPSLYNLQKYLFTDDELKKYKEKAKEKQYKLLDKIKITKEEYKEAEQSIKDYLSKNTKYNKYYR